jgi:hypothetical protein
VFYLSLSLLLSQGDSGENGEPGLQGELGGPVSEPTAPSHHHLTEQLFQHSPTTPHYNSHSLPLHWREGMILLQMQKLTDSYIYYNKTVE